MSDAEPYTKVPNALLELLPFLPDAECRVMLVISRKTHGYHKVCDVISLSQLIDATGMARQGVLNGIAAAIKRGILKRTPSGYNNGYCYEIVADQVVHEVDHLKQSTKQTSPRSRPLVVHEVDHLGPQVVHEVDTQKKDLKKDLKKVRETRAPAQANIDSLHEGVAIYKRLTGKRTVPPITASTIAAKVTDCPRFELAAATWINAGYKQDNIGGILDWYDHPEKMERRNGTHPPNRHAAATHNASSKPKRYDE